MIITVPKIGNGTEGNPYRPDTTEDCWTVIEEKKTEFVIEIKQE